MIFTIISYKSFVYFGIEDKLIMWSITDNSPETIKKMEQQANMYRELAKFNSRGDVMKCNACEYEYTDGFDYERKVFLPKIGDKRFVIIRGSFTIERELNWGSALEEVTIYACPKCGTLKMNTEW